LVLAGTFAVLAIVGGSGSGNSQVRQIGFGLAVGILLDTFVVRTVLVPSTVSLIGRWNWWPSPMGRHRATETRPTDTQIGTDTEIGTGPAVPGAAASGSDRTDDAPRRAV
jgi:RND superfamily putative drug exporter